MLPRCTFKRQLSNLVSKFYHVMSFYALQVCFEQIYYAFAKKPDKLFWARLKKVTFAFAGKQLEHLESIGILCVHRAKFFNALNVRRYKNLTEQIQCFCNNVTYRLSAATNQSTNDQREQRLHLNTSQLALNQDPTVC